MFTNPVVSWRARADALIEVRLVRVNAVLVIERRSETTSSWSGLAMPLGLGVPVGLSGSGRVGAVFKMTLEFGDDDDD